MKKIRTYGSYTLYLYIINKEPIVRDMIKVNQIVKLKEEFKTPRCKKGGNFDAYKVIKVNRVNVIAFNLGTFINCELRIDQLETIEQKQIIK